MYPIIASFNTTYTTKLVLLPVNEMQKGSDADISNGNIPIIYINKQIFSIDTFHIFVEYFHNFVMIKS